MRHAQRHTECPAVGWTDIGREERGVSRLLHQRWDLAPASRFCRVPLPEVSPRVSAGTRARGENDVERVDGMGCALADDDRAPDLRPYSVRVASAVGADTSSHLFRSPAPPLGRRLGRSIGCGRCRRSASPAWNAAPVGPSSGKWNARRRLSATSTG